MKRNIIIYFLACVLFYSLESCEKSSRNNAHNYNPPTKTDHTFDKIDEAIRQGESGMKKMGYPPLSEAMQELKYRCETLGETAACAEFNQNMQQSIKRMNQEMQRMDAEKRNY